MFWSFRQVKPMFQPIKANDSIIHLKNARPRWPGLALKHRSNYFFVASSGLTAGCGVCYLWWAPSVATCMPHTLPPALLPHLSYHSHGQAILSAVTCRLFTSRVMCLCTHNVVLKCDRQLRMRTLMLREWRVISCGKLQQNKTEISMPCSPRESGVKIGTTMSGSVLVRISPR